MHRAGLQASGAQRSALMSAFPKSAQAGRPTTMSSGATGAAQAFFVLGHGHDDSSLSLTSTGDRRSPVQSSSSTQTVTWDQLCNTISVGEFSRSEQTVPLRGLRRCVRSGANHLGPTSINAAAGGVRAYACVRTMYASYPSHR